MLNVGVSRGANLFPAAVNIGSHGQIIGIDLAENILTKTAREIQHRNIVQSSILQMDAEHFVFDSISFDNTLCGFAITCLVFWLPRGHPFCFQTPPRGSPLPRSYGDEALPTMSTFRPLRLGLSSSTQEHPLV